MTQISAPSPLTAVLIYTRIHASNRQWQFWPVRLSNSYINEEECVGIFGPSLYNVQITLGRFSMKIVCAMYIMYIFSGYLSQTRSYIFRHHAHGDITSTHKFRVVQKCNMASIEVYQATLYLCMPPFHSEAYRFFVSQIHTESKRKKMVPCSIRCHITEIVPINRWYTDYLQPRNKEPELSLPKNT